MGSNWIKVGDVGGEWIKTIPTVGFSGLIPSIPGRFIPTTFPFRSNGGIWPPIPFPGTFPVVTPDSRGGSRCQGWISGAVAIPDASPRFPPPNPGVLGPNPVSRSASRAMFSKKKKRVEISAPSNFEHRVHTGYDASEQRFTGLPRQWQGLLEESARRPKPLVDPACITAIRGAHKVRGTGSVGIRGEMWGGQSVAVLGLGSWRR